MGDVTFVGVIYTTPRVGQNAVLSSLRTVIPGAAEGAESATLSDGRLVFSKNSAFIHPPDPAADVTGPPVWISRRDRVAQAISWAIAAQSQRFHSAQSEQVLHVGYDRGEIERAVEAIADGERYWEQILLGVSYLKLWYEDHIIGDPSSAAGLILDWWGIDGHPGPPTFCRFDEERKAEWRTRWDRNE